jgi:hypothetical protein
VNAKEVYVILGPFIRKFSAYGDIIYFPSSKADKIAITLIAIVSIGICPKAMIVKVLSGQKRSIHATPTI